MTNLGGLIYDSVDLVWIAGLQIRYTGFQIARYQYTGNNNLLIALDKKNVLYI